MKDLSELDKDRKEHYGLKNFCAFEKVEDLAKHLVKVHREMLSGQHSCFGYLYTKQVEKNKQLKKEIEECKQTINKLEATITKPNMSIGTL